MRTSPTSRRLIGAAGFALAMAGLGLLIGTALQPHVDRDRHLLLLSVASGAVMAGLLTLLLMRVHAAGPIAAMTLLVTVVVLLPLALPDIATFGAPTEASPAITPTAEETMQATASVVPDSDVAVLVGAGDIASCGSDGDEATAALLDEIDGVVFTAGDNAYDNGTSAEFEKCYGPSWGRHLDRTRPVPGDHDYRTPGAAGYFGYFGERAGDPEKGYYAYDLGAWRIYALNAECDQVGGCDAGSPQEAWLRADLAEHPRTCVAAYAYRPRFSSGLDGGSTAVAGLWKALHDAEAELYLSGHDHDYERFAQQDPDGYRDPGGLRQFVVGTGGEEVRPLRKPVANSEVRIGETFGVLKLTLHRDRYEWEFIPTAPDAARDAGSDDCH